MTISEDQKMEQHKAQQQKAALSKVCVWREREHAPCFIKALFRLYYGTIKALGMLYQQGGERERARGSEKARECERGR